jgi:hypothetical protein
MYLLDTSDFWAHYIQTMIVQKGWGDSIIQLVEIIGETYAFVHEVEPFQKIHSHLPTIISLTKQTLECGYFIRDYAKIKNFCMLVPTLSGGHSFC